MTKPDLFLLMALAGGAICTGGGILLWKSKDQDADQPANEPHTTTSSKNKGPQKTTAEIKRLSLSDASRTWVDKKEKTIPLERIASLWVTPDVATASESPVFQRDGLSVFWNEQIEGKKNIKPRQRDAIAALMKILDQMGDCPSVVRNPKHNTETENKYKDDVFTMLSNVPLWQHSLCVAKHAAKRVGRDGLISDAIIIGLGHDLGKIPTYHDKGYTTGDHPLISAMVLAGIKEFIALPNKEDLEDIIRSHHHLSPKNPMAALLKECDQIVRNEEISAGLHHAVKTEQVAAQQQEIPNQPAVSVTATISSDILPQPEPDPAEQTDHPLGHTDTSKPGFKTSREEMPWFNPVDLLTTLKGWINVTKDGQWGAVSMPDGLVYVRQECLWGIIRKIAPQEILPDILTADGDEAAKRTILHNAVWSLSETHNAVAAEMIAPNHYMTQVIIVYGGNKHNKELLIPFRAEAFGCLPSELEHAKQPAIKKLVKNIRPSQQEK